MARILLIDDDDSVRRVLRILLERAGHHVVEAENGRRALRALADQPADLVITDIFMPDMEGIETIRALRGAASEVKIIAMSGGGRTAPGDFLEVAKMLGAGAILQKPFDGTELLAAVEDVLR